MSLPKLPSSITVQVNGSPLALAGKPNKEGSRIWFEESGLVPELIDDAELVRAALESTSVSFEGSALNAGEVHVSEPRKYSAKHEKAGQVVPNTGGNQTVTHSLSIVLNDADGGEHRYTLMVTVTYVAAKGFRINAKAIANKATKVLTGVSFAA